MEVIKELLSNPGVQAAIASLAIPVVIQKVKKWTNVQKTWVINIIVGALSIITVAVDGLLSNGVADFGQLGMRSAAIIATIQYVYPIIIKPATDVLEDVRELRLSRLNAVTSPIQNINLVPDQTAQEIKMEFDPNQPEPVDPIKNA